MNDSDELTDSVAELPIMSPVVRDLPLSLLPPPAGAPPAVQWHVLEQVGKVSRFQDRHMVMSLIVIAWNVMGCHPEVGKCPNFWGLLSHH